MLNRYIGNKNVIIDEILDVVARHAASGSLVCDAFSGSLAVSLALKRAGYRVAANDVNLLSAVYGRAYLANNCVPPVNFDHLLPNDGHVRLLARAEQLINSLASRPGCAYLSDPRFKGDACR